MLTMIHANRARLDKGVFYVDRKFHTGMQEYLQHLDVPILSIHPELAPNDDSLVMDLVGVPEGDLGYRVMTLRCPVPNQPLPQEAARLQNAIARSQLVYGTGFNSRAMCVAHGVPYVGLLEYNLRTNWVFATAGVEGILFRAWRGLRAARYHLTEVVPSMRRAAMLHCNGYPVFEESAWFNRHRLLYLDSRMRASMLIADDRLRGRLAARRQRVPRLLFSGRFEPAKGALDVVKVAAEPALRDVACEFVIYGQGSQRPAMDRLIADRGLSDRVKIHEPVPYPRLVEIAGGCDVFVCCHVQDDPSCTYLESMGCGLPVVGYANAMWRAMQADSRAGVVTRLGATDRVAEALRDLLSNPDQLDALSWNARAFATAHTFEREFARRTDSLKELWRTSRANREASSPSASEAL
jgi:glycosyltransferase involved in cell wall biosynthesis